MTSIKHITHIMKPRMWVIAAGMPCGPLEIPEEFRAEEEAVISYVLMTMRTRIKNRIVVEWSDKRKLLFYRNASGDPYLESVMDLDLEGWKKVEPYTVLSDV